MKFPVAILSPILSLVKKNRIQMSSKVKMLFSAIFLWITYSVSEIRLFSFDINNWAKLFRCISITWHPTPQLGDEDWLICTTDRQNWPSVRQWAKVQHYTVRSTFSKTVRHLGKIFRQWAFHFRLLVSSWAKTIDNSVLLLSKTVQMSWSVLPNAEVMCGLDLPCDRKWMLQK